MSYWRTWKQGAIFCGACAIMIGLSVGICRALSMFLILLPLEMIWGPQTDDVEKLAWLVVSLFAAPVWVHTLYEGWVQANGPFFSD